MLIQQRCTFADEFLLHVLLPHLPDSTCHLLRLIGLWSRPVVPRKTSFPGRPRWFRHEVVSTTPAVSEPQAASPHSDGGSRA